MGSPRVSVLVPVRNRQDLLGPCLRSALDQTLRDLEVVVADNASTDGTWAVCEEFAARDPRVRVFRNDSDVGPVRNWERCLAEARAPLAKLLFSDDALEPAFLERTIPFLDDSAVGFAFTAARIGPRPGEGSVFYRAWTKGGTYPGGDFVSRALGFGNVPVSPGCALFRTADLRKNLRLEIPSPSLRDFAAHGAGPDLLLYLLTAKDYPLVGFVPEPLAFFRHHPDSITVGAGADLMRPRYVQAQIWFAREHGGERLLRRLCSRVWWEECRRRGRWLPAREALGPYLDAERLPVGTLNLVRTALGAPFRSARRLLNRLREGL
ncbi:MAG: glycosyltransferase [Planctomycetales bacterium]|nr:glycosyltransferase [Planctomycetales bacterium]